MEFREPPATYAEYLLVPEDGPRYEIIGGVGSLTPAPDSRHQTIVDNLHFYLGKHVRERGLGRLYAAPFDVVLSETVVSAGGTIAGDVLSGLAIPLAEIFAGWTRCFGGRVFALTFGPGPRGSFSARRGQQAL